jgi:hypothetical protein
MVIFHMAMLKNNQMVTIANRWDLFGSMGISMDFRDLTNRYQQISTLYWRYQASKQRLNNPYMMVGRSTVCGFSDLGLINKNVRRG